MCDTYFIHAADVACMVRVAFNLFDYSMLAALEISYYGSYKTSILHLG